MTELRTIFNRIFRPNDGTVRAIVNASNHEASRTIAAADRLFDTVNEVMALNDRITGRIRAKENAKHRKI